MERHTTSSKPSWTTQPTNGEVETTTVRYIVRDVPESVAFYTEHLGFTVVMQGGPGSGFAMLARGTLRLALSGTSGPGGGSRPMPDGRKPEPGGWNRIMLVVSDLEAEVARLRAAGIHLRNDIVESKAGRQVLVEDPSGNAIELFQPT